MTDLNTMTEELKRRAYRRQVAETDFMVRNALKLCKRFQRVEDWLEQYKTIKRRYKFLVLLGSSGCGKTMFARTLAAPQTKALELNFASVLEPDLCAFKDNSDLYDVIIFRKMKAHTNLTQKSLFQCSISIIVLADPPRIAMPAPC